MLRSAGLTSGIESTQQGEEPFERVHAREWVRARIFGETTVMPRIGRYVVRGLLGRGGLGVVYRAYDPILDRDVAVKLLRDEIGTGSKAQANLLAEARNLARVVSPNIVPVFDVGESNGRLFLAMELVSGQNLREWLQRVRPSVPEILRVFAQAARGLAAVHASGLVHRDFKPDNVLLGDDGVARVVDFGLARLAEGTATAASEDDEPTTRDRATKPLDLAGTIVYMAPELFGGARASVASDVFSFAVALFEALYGRLPFGGGSIHRHFVASAQDRVVEVERDDVSPTVHDAVLRGLTADPDRRWPTIDAFADALHSGSAARGGYRGFMLLGIAAIAIGAWAAGDRRDDACIGAQRRLDAVYDATVRDQLVAKFSTLDELAGPGGRTVLVRLDTFASTWRDALGEACTSPEHDDFDTRMTCLRGDARAFSAIVAGLSELLPGTESSAVDATERLPDPTACLTAGPPRRREGQSAAVVAATDRALWEQALGQCERALPAVGEVLALADLELDRGLIARALLVRASCRLDGSAVDSALDDVEDAYYLATAEADLDVAAEAADMLAFNAAYRRAEIEPARMWLRAAESLIARGATGLDAGDLALTAAAIDDVSGDALSAVGRLERALAEQACSDCGSTSRLHEGLAVLYMDLDRGAEAVTHARAVVEFERRHFGADNRRVHSAQVDLVGALQSADQIDEALAIGEATRDAAMARPILAPAELASLLNGVGGMLLVRGDYERGVASLEQAVALVGDSTADPSRFATSLRYTLARAYATRHDPRAVAMLQEVAATLEGTMGADATELAIVLSTLSLEQHSQQDDVAAVATMRRALAILERRPPANPMDGVTIMRQAAGILIPVDPTGARREPPAAQQAEEEQDVPPQH